MSLSGYSQCSRQNNPSKINHSSGQNSPVAPVWFKANVRVFTPHETATRCAHPSPRCPSLPVPSHGFHFPNAGLLVVLCKCKHVLGSGTPSKISSSRYPHGFLPLSFKSYLKTHLPGRPSLAKLHSSLEPTLHSQPAWVPILTLPLPGGVTLSMLFTHSLGFRFLIFKRMIVET